MPRPSKSSPDPWWLHLLSAAVVYVVGVHLLPAWTFENPFIEQVTNSLPTMAMMFSQLFVLMAALTSIRPLIRWIKQRKLLENNTDLESIRALSWDHFEHLVGEAFRQQGYRVSLQGGAGPDGGVDLTLHRQGKKTVVQCKHWHSGKVGVSVIREHLGVMSAQGTDQGIVVCTGEFTQPAIEFAADNGIRLINGSALEKLIDREKPAPPRSPEKPPLDCPTCGSTMVERLARTGPRAGNRFLGCSLFPGCRGTRSLT